MLATDAQLVTSSSKSIRSQQKRRRSIIEDRRQRISENFNGSNGVAQDTGMPAQPEPTEEELRASFDDWMKIVADNKINANNSWKLALIDYFHDLNLLKDGDSINFQKASCTLDGCVKIYTSRVDCVDSETKKLLSGLIDNQRNKFVDDEEEVEGEDGEPVKVPKKREHRPGNTLEKDISNLDLKKFDQEFVVDPLFRKTSADFDEGGARGLLLNHLSISPLGQIIFDADDSTMLRDANVNVSASQKTVDMDKLMARFQDTILQANDYEICWPLKDFEFTNENQYFDPVLDFNKEPVVEDIYEFGGPADDDFGGDDVDYDFGPPEDFGGFTPADEDQGAGVPGEYFVPAMADSEENIFSYFDTRMLRNWAGPSHWRSRPLSERKETIKPKKKVAKVQEHIDFANAGPLDLKTLFAKGSASINLSKTEKNNNLLPEDMHFSSRDLLKLFTNPEFKMVCRSKTSKSLQSSQAEFWADNEVLNAEEMHVQANPDSHGGDFEFDDPFGFEDESFDATPTDMGEGASTGHANADMSAFLDYGDQLVDQPKKVFSAPLKYAKTAKRVDVKKLKENIWKELIDLTDESSETPPQEDVKLKDEKKFSDLVHGLDNFYSEKKRGDISVAFCFICVLHLANEQNLYIKGSEHLKDLVIGQNE